MSIWVAGIGLNLNVATILAELCVFNGQNSAVIPTVTWHGTLAAVCDMDLSGHAIKIGTRSFPIHDPLQASECQIAATAIRCGDCDVLPTDASVEQAIN